MNIEESSAESSQEKSKSDTIDDFVAIVVAGSPSANNRRINKGIRKITKKKKRDSPGISAEDLGIRRIDGLSLLETDVNGLIKDHLQTLRLRIKGHSDAAELYEKRDKIIGYPITILSSFTSSTLMITISNEASSNDRIFKVVGICLSLTAFILSVSRDYLSMGKKSQAHDLSAKLYTNLLRDIEVKLVNGHISEKEKRNIFRDIIERMSVIEQYELPIPTVVACKLETRTPLVSP
jgi:hypothetical protein